jgi:N-acetylmuramoyl-L-alanine amidase
MTALEGLLAGIMGRWPILPPGIIGHSDMAPGRKVDPGVHFDWRRLARAGLSVWPDDLPGDVPADPAMFLRAAVAFGYPALDQGTVLAAFRMRFRPWATGPVDTVDAGLAADLARRFPPA